MLQRILLVGLLLTAGAFAQGKGKGGGGGGGGQQQMPMMSGPSSRSEMFSDILKLDKDGKKQLKAIMDEAQKEANPVRDEIEKGRLAVADAVAGGKQEAIDAAVKACAAFQSQMAALEMNAFAKLFQSLDKDQQARSPQVFQSFPGIFMGKNWNDIPGR
jgi:Spy/CpxP family protein refolding chaperone